MHPPVDGQNQMCQRCPVHSAKSLVSALLPQAQSRNLMPQAARATATFPDWARRTFLIGRKKDGLHELHDSTLVGLTLPPIAHPGLPT